MKTFRDLSVGDLIYVYSHSDSSIRKGIVSKIQGMGYEDSPNPDEFGSFGSINVSFGFSKRMRNIHGDLERQFDFAVVFSDEKNRRGTNYTGFVTKEDAVEFKKYLLTQIIDDLNTEIKRAQEKLEKID